MKLLRSRNPPKNKMSKTQDLKFTRLPGPTLLPRLLQILRVSHLAFELKKVLQVPQLRAESESRAAMQTQQSSLGLRCFSGRMNLHHVAEHRSPAVTTCCYRATALHLLPWRRDKVAVGKHDLLLLCHRRSLGVWQDTIMLQLERRRRRNDNSLT